MKSSEKNWHNRMQMTYTLHQQTRRSIAIGVTDVGEVFVKAPIWMGTPQIEEFLWSKEIWIKKRLSAVKENKEALDMLMRDGELLYLGGILKVVAKPATRARIIGNLLVLDSTRKIEDQVYLVLKKEAKRIIADLIEELEPIMGVKVKAFRLKDNSTNWGSASGRKNLNFNWRIIMAPLEVVRYLVIHEMAHLRYMNHSKTYWNFVAQFDTDWEDNDMWLKHNGGVLRVL